VAFLLVEYHDLAPGTEREIFQRVQLGMTLTAAGILFLCHVDSGSMQNRETAGNLLAMGRMDSGSPH